MTAPVSASRRRFVLIGAVLGASGLGAGTWLWRRVADPLQQRPYPPATVGANERCPVCGMYPARFARWKTQIVLQDGKHFSFDSLLDLFRYLARQPGLAVGDTYLSDYGVPAAGVLADPSPRPWIVASSAFLVLDSRLKGPMGEPGLPAFAERESALALAGQRGGSVIEFAALTAEKRQQLIQHNQHG